MQSVPPTEAGLTATTASAGEVVGAILLEELDDRASVIRHVSTSGIVDYRLRLCSWPIVLLADSAIRR